MFLYQIGQLSGRIALITDTCFRIRGVGYREDAFIHPLCVAKLPHIEVQFQSRFLVFFLNRFYFSILEAQSSKTP